MTELVSVVKMGRLCSEKQGGHGVVRHAMEKENYCLGTKNKALCGTKPGKRSVGFASDKSIKEITCNSCKKKIGRMESALIVDYEY